MLTGILQRVAGRFPLTVMVSGMIAWALHLALVYALVGLGCTRGWRDGAAPAAGALQAALIVATLLALVAALAVGSWGWRRRRDVVPTADVPQPRFIARTTMLLAVLAVIAIAFTATPLLMLPPCRT